MKITFSVLLVYILTCCSGAFADESIAEMKSSKLERVGELVHENREHGGALRQIREEAEKSDDQMSSSGMKMFQGLAFCVGLLLVGSGIYRKFGRGKSLGGSTSRIKILERSALSARAMVVLAEIDGQKVLFTTGSDQVQTVLLDSNNIIAGFDREVETACKENIRLSA